MPGFELPRDTYTAWHQRGLPVGCMNPALYGPISSRGEGDLADWTSCLTLHRMADVESRSARTPQSSRGSTAPFSSCLSMVALDLLLPRGNAVHYPLVMT